MVSSIDIRIEMNRLKAIFLNENNWQKFLNRHKGKIRPVVKKEVDKFLHCGDMSNGFRTFKCEACPHVKNIPIRCKGKFCPTCAVGEAQKWAEIQSNDMYRTIHRHVVFTMDEGLRSIFAGHYRQALLKGLMDEAARLMNDWFVKQGMTPGIVVALHTFGSRLEFNPHIHMLVTMGGVTPDGKWKTYDYFPYSRLRKQWQTVVLKLIRRTLSTRAKKIVQPLLQEAYANNPDGFYVNAPKRSHTDVKGLLAYIGRYMKRGPIALHRIIMFDEEVVTFSYQDKRDGEWKAETLPVERARKQKRFLEEWWNSLTLLMVGIRWILPGFRVNSTLVKWCRFIMRVLTVSSTITESHKNNGYAQSPKGGGVAELFLHR